MLDLFGNKFPNPKRHFTLGLNIESMETDIKKTIKAGFEDYIPKPIDISQFIEKIDSIVCKKK